MFFTRPGTNGRSIYHHYQTLSLTQTYRCINTPAYEHALIFHISFGRRTYINPVALFELSIHSSHGRGLFALCGCISQSICIYYGSLQWSPSHFTLWSFVQGWMEERRSLWQVEIVSPHLPSAVILNDRCTSLSRCVDGCMCGAYECVFLCLPAGRRGLMAGVLTCPGDSPCSISGTSSQRALIFSWPMGRPSVSSINQS